MIENNATPKRLYRSRQEKMVAGVAGGLAQYFKVDPVLVRVAFVALALTPGLGGVAVLAYIVMAIVVPQRPLGEDEPAVVGTSFDTTRGRELVGFVLAGLGVLILIGNLGVYNILLPFGVHLQNLWPLALIVLGVALLARRRD